jgi:hypothetical protein
MHLFTTDNRGLMDDMFKGLLVDLMANIEQVARISSM